MLRRRRSVTLHERELPKGGVNGETICPSWLGRVCSRLVLSGKKLSEFQGWFQCTLRHRPSMRLAND